jgi:hypothetical protein
LLSAGNTFPLTKTHRLKGKDGKMISQANELRKQAGAAILISDKVDFNLVKEIEKVVTSNKGNNSSGRYND